MANIRENKRNGKVISYRFTACLGRDANDKQIRRYTTWEIPDGLTPAKAKKAAERAADAWEQEVKAEYQKEKELGQAYTLPPEKRRDSFPRPLPARFTPFVRDVASLPGRGYQERTGNLRPCGRKHYPKLLRQSRPETDASRN